MSLPRVASRDEWLAARLELLAEEKELTRRRDELNAKRRELPMVRLEQDYVLTGPDGPVPFVDLFEGRPQLIVYHFMFEPDAEDGCPSCTATTDEMSPGLLEHLRVRDTSFALVSRAPIEKLERYRAKRGWDYLRWYSSAGTSFNDDFGVTIHPEADNPSYNYRDKAADAARGGTFFEWHKPFEMFGRSAFLQVDGTVYHTYSQYARALESTGGSYYFLDLTALGRQEDWEKPEGRSGTLRPNRPDFAS